MAYASWSVVFGEQPSAAKWNILGTNDASFNDGTGFAAGAIGPASRSGGFYGVTHVFSNATGTQTVTGLGFKPKGLVVVGNGDSSTSTLAVCGSFAYDTGSGTVQGGLFGVMSESGPSAGSISSTSNTFVRSDASGSANFAASVTAWDADGITVNVGTSSATAAYRTYHILFFG